MDPSTAYAGIPGHILLLSDEIILMILQYLDTEDLLNLCQTCTRLRRIGHEQKLWRDIHVTDSYEKLRPIFYNFLNQHTSSLRIESKIRVVNNGYRSSLPSSLLSKLSRGQSSENGDNVEVLPNLKTLSLNYLRFSISTFRFQYLPPSVSTLDLSGTSITNVTERSFYFKDIYHYLPNLENLNLSYCTWVPAHALMALSKLPLLQRLYLRGCRGIGNCLAYSCLAFRFGFQNLRVLDATNANFAATELQAACGLKHLEEFYVGEYDYFDYEGDELRDMNIAAFSQHPKIQILDISGHSISDTSLRYLAGTKSLYRLDAYFTSITPAAAKSFMEARKDCVVNIGTLPSSETDEDEIV